MLLLQIYAQISSRAGAECAASFHFLYAFVLNKTFRQYHVCFNDPKLNEAIKITASSSPSPTPSTPVFRNITYYIYSKFHNDMLPSQAMMGQYVKQDSNFPMHFYGLRQFEITFVCKAPKLEGAVKRTASGSHPFIWKCYKLYIGLISKRYGLILDRDGPAADLPYAFLLNITVWHYRFCLQGFKTARSIQNNGLWSPHSLENIIEIILMIYIAQLEKIWPNFWPLWTRMCTKILIPLCSF